MHKLVAFILGCVAGYMLNEYVESVLESLGGRGDALALPEDE